MNEIIWAVILEKENGPFLLIEYRIEGNPRQTIELNMTWRQLQTLTLGGIATLGGKACSMS